jgi:ATP-dependent helicase HrpB
MMAAKNSVMLPSPVSLPKSSLCFECIEEKPKETSTRGARTCEKEAEILGMVTEARQSVVRGPTGCGKSTIVPPLVLGQAQRCGKQVLLIHPKSVACRSLCNRLKKEGWAPKLAIGGQSDANACKASFIIATPGIVLEWASRGHLSWKNVYACIFDEAPDSSPEAEMVYALCKQDGRPKMVTLSASPSGSVLKDAGEDVVDFGGERKYPLARFQPVSPGRLSDQELDQAAAQLASEELLRHGNVIVFCEGRERISNLHGILTATLPPEAHILTLYAGMESDEREDEDGLSDSGGGGEINYFRKPGSVGVLAKTDGTN